MVLVVVDGGVGSFAMLLVVAFFLGIAGTVFAVGIPFVSAWYAASRRGFATGVFGMGMGGTAIAAFLTPRLVRSIGYLPTHLLLAGLLAVTAALALVVTMLLRGRADDTVRPSVRAGPRAGTDRPEWNRVS